jgi:hypothetical protein
MAARGLRDFWGKWKISIAFIFLALVTAFGFTAWQREVDARLTADCQQQNDTTRVVRALIAEATTPSGANAVDLTALPSYIRLDAATQEYLVELGIALTLVPNASAERLEEFADRLPVRDCSNVSP